ncbi:hypothetical protein GCM10010385_65960 [Streptomyces geysiriensis]|nr:hypothetical protein GCM10010385_65960 [Streptomyces geysiriensis]GGZ40042.1 hypothetical protein GCM10010301_09700 [Streptomyces plicatus]GHC25794.1 hypothetical protein GCM10010308_48180 [Streptomyces vinaceusdrappus]
MHRGVVLVDLLYQREEVLTGFAGGDGHTGASLRGLYKISYESTGGHREAEPVRPGARTPPPGYARAVRP